MKTSLLCVMRGARGVLDVSLCVETRESPCARRDGVTPPFSIQRVRFTSLKKVSPKIRFC